MSTLESKYPMQVIIGDGALDAKLIIPAGLPREAITATSCESILKAAGVELTPQVSEALTALAAAPPSINMEHRLVIARATPPVAGTDGKIQWVTSTPSPEPPTDPDAKDDFFRREAVHLVKLGQLVGRVIPPTPGKPGRDVTGKPIPAALGKSAEVQLAGGVTMDDRGQVVAQVDGSLAYSETTVVVRQRLELPEPVDPATGDVNFKGEVIARQGVLDRGVIRCSGSADVTGAIAAATIECGGNLVARGGASGHQTGCLRVGGSLVAKYLGNISGSVVGDTFVQREAINTDLTIGGGLYVRAGVVRGGTLVVTGPVEVAVLGGDSGVQTHLILGTVPFVEPNYSQLEKIFAKLNSQRDRLVAEQKLTSQNPRLAAADKERLTEIMFNLQTINNNISRVTDGLATLSRRIHQQRTVHLLATEKVHSGTKLTIRGTEYLIRKDLRGPVRITAGKPGEVFCQCGDAAPTALEQATRQRGAGA